MDGKLLVQGILNSSGEELRLVYALLVETKMHNMLFTKVKDMVNKDIDHFNEALQEEIEKLGIHSDQELQLRLFLYLLKMSNVKGAHYNVLSEIEQGCEQIITNAHQLQIVQDEKYKFFIEGKVMPKANLLVTYQMQNIFQSFDDKRGEMTEEQMESFIEQIVLYLDQLPAKKQQQIMDKLQVDELTKRTLKKVLASKDSVTMLSIIVEVAGFKAFTTLTSVIAATVGFFDVTLPLGAYMFATSALSILTGPLGIGLVLLGSTSMRKKQNDKTRLAMLPMGITQLLLPVVIDGEKKVEAEGFIAEWQKIHDELQDKHAVMIKLVEQYEKLDEEKNVCETLVTSLNEILQKTKSQRIQSFEILKQKCTAIEPEEQSEQYKQLSLELQTILHDMKAQNDVMLTNNQQTGLWSTIKNKVSNVSIKNDLKLLQKRFFEVEQSRVYEVLRSKPASVRTLCDEVEQLDRENTQLEKDITASNTNSAQCIADMNELVTQIDQLRKQIKQHHSIWYGLKDVE